MKAKIFLKSDFSDTTEIIRLILFLVLALPFKYQKQKKMILDVKTKHVQMT